MVDLLVNSRVTSIRYALLTQLLGKIANPERSLMYLQSGTTDEGAWNARSFCDAVIVPWVASNHDVIGKSAEPYASKPLRRVRLTPNMPDVRDKAEWQRLVAFFDLLDKADTETLRQAFRRCLASVARRLAKQSFRYRIPQRVSLLDLELTLETFLSEQSGGLRLLAVTAALMRTIGEGFSLFSIIRSQGVNEADSASGMPGDIMCYGKDNQISLVVEVKDRNLTLVDLRSSSRKVNEESDDLSSLLFVVPSAKQSESAEIDEWIKSTWASGLNVYRTDILSLASSVLMLLGEEWRPRLLREIGSDLDARGNHEHRLVWYELLSALAEA